MVKKKKDKQCKERGSWQRVFTLWSFCRRDLVLEQSPMLSVIDTRAGRRIWGSSVKTVKRFILVIQPET